MEDAELFEVAETIYDGWYADKPRIDWEDFVDRLEETTGEDLGTSMLSIRIKKIQTHIRKYRQL